ncbi:hypothetical protein ACHQM5_002610 [Ranunculus cassubicifolius]
MATLKSSSRYNSRSSQISDPSSSSEFKTKMSKPLIKTKSSDLATGSKHQNLSSMVKKFMENKSNPKPTSLFIPPEKKKKTSTFPSFHRKLFHKENKPPLALTEVKSNTRTLAMVLRSERELLNQNRDFQSQITELNLLLDDKNTEVEKLKDLCLKQREEIKALKNAILFPDVINTQLQGLLQKQGSELQQAKHVIPTLQRQVTSLTGQLQCLADDLKEVKADKYAARSCFEGRLSSPGTPIFDHEASNSLEFSSEEDRTSCVSEDDMFLKDYNPCLTPYSAKSKYNKEIDEVWGYNSPPGAGSNTKVRNETPYFYQQQVGKLSRSSELCERTNRAFRLSNENRHNYSRSAQAFLK